MKLLYAPWRDCYTKKLQGKDSQEKQPVCVFCHYAQDTSNDNENLILGRYTYHFIVMNKYPYNAGHLLIVPYAHCDNLELLSKEAITECAVLTQKAATLLTTHLKNEGTNIGLNLGKAAGAGIPDHIHTHILPRWIGDTNFLPTLCDTKQISIDMKTMYDTLKPHFSSLV